MDNKTDKRYLLTEASIIALAFICACSIASKPYIWFDESFTMGLARQSVPELIRITAMDVHPPLYYLLVKLFITLFGDSIFVFHLPSLLCYVGLLAVSALFFNRYFDKQLSLFITAGLCSVPGMLEHVLWIRMYSMAMLLVASGYYVTYIIMKKSNGDISFRHLWKDWTGLALINVAAAYTHYFAGVAVVGSSLFLLFFLLLKKRHLRAFIPWGIHCGIMLLLYLPWIPVLFQQMSAIDGNYWIQPVSEMELHTYPAILFFVNNDMMRHILIILFVTGCFLCLLHYRRSTEALWVVGCFVVVLFWFLFGVGYSVLRNPILVNRYFVILFPLVWIPPVYGHTLLKKTGLYAAVVIVFTFCFIQNYEAQYEYYVSSYNVSMYHYLDSHLQEGDIFFHSFVQNQTVYEAYFPEYDHYVLDTTMGMEMESVRALSGGQVISSIEEIPDNAVNIWCSDDGGISGFDMTTFEALGCHVETIELTGGRLYHVFKNLP